MNSSTLNYHGTWAWVGFTKLAPRPHCIKLTAGGNFMLRSNFHGGTVLPWLLLLIAKVTIDDVLYAVGPNVYLVFIQDELTC